MERTRICRNIAFGSPRRAIHVASVTMSSTLDIKKQSQMYLNGQNPGSFEDRIICMSMFNDMLNGHRQYRNLVAHRQRGGNMCRGPVKKYVVELKFQRI